MKPPCRAWARSSIRRSRAQEPRASTLRSRAQEPRASTLRSRAQEPRASTRSGWTLAACALLALTGLACTDPTYRTAADDGGAPVSVADDGRVPQSSHGEAGTTKPATQDPAPSASTTDASVRTDADAAITVPTGSSDAGPTSWWTPLSAHEHYALRVRFFSRDRALGNNVGFSHEILFWAKLRVEAASNTVAMEMRRCVDHGVITSSVTLRDDFSWTHAARLPPEQHILALRDGKIRSESAPRTLGYEPVQPDGCTTPGARIAARPEQVWLLDGKCECRSEPLPLLRTDCRVTDVDNDGQPGLTITHVGFGAMVEAARVKDNCQIEDGVLDAEGRLRATYVENYDVLDLSCGNTACSRNDIVGCPRELNTALFEPLPDLSPSGKPWDCAQVVVEAERLLPSEMLGFPITGC